MNKDFDILFKENKENGTKVMKDLDRGKTIILLAMVLHFTAILGVLCLLFLDTTLVDRIIWGVILFAYFGVNLADSIYNLGRVLKAKHRVKMTNQTVEIMHDLLNGGNDKDA